MQTSATQMWPKGSDGVRANSNVHFPRGEVRGVAKNRVKTPNKFVKTIRIMQVFRAWSRIAPSESENQAQLFSRFSINLTGRGHTHTHDDCNKKREYFDARQSSQNPVLLSFAEATLFPDKCIIPTGISHRYLRSQLTSLFRYWCHRRLSLKNEFALFLGFEKISTFASGSFVLVHTSEQKIKTR